MTTIYLDIDGVLADFVTGSIEACDLPLTHDQVTEWDYYKPYMEAKEFWKCIHAQQYFWEDLPVYPWAHDLVKMLSEFGEIVYCSDPSSDDEAASGKIKWLKRHGFLKPDGKNFVLTPCKWLLAGPERVLVDDYGYNTAAFSRQGGAAILFPQPWNHGRALPYDRVEVVRDWLVDELDDRRRRNWR